MTADEEVRQQVLVWFQRCWKWLLGLAVFELANIEGSTQSLAHETGVAWGGHAILFEITFLWRSSAPPIPITSTVLISLTFCLLGSSVSPCIGNHPLFLPDAAIFMVHSAFTSMGHAKKSLVSCSIQLGSFIMSALVIYQGECIRHVSGRRR